LLRTISLLLLLFCLPWISTHAQDGASVRYEWDLTDLYSSDEAWQGALNDVQRRIAALPMLKGTLGKNAKSMSTALTEISDSYKEAGRVYIYASLSRDEDQRDPKAQQRFAQARQMLSDYTQAVAWLNPEVLSVGEKKVERFLKQEPSLAKFSFMLRDV